MPYTVNGDPASLPEPVLKGGTTFVPGADLANMVGGFVDWNHEAKTARIEIGGKVAVVGVKTSVIDVDGADHDLGAISYIQDDLIWIPVRIFRDVFGLSLSVDGTHVNLSV